MGAITGKKVQVEIGAPQREKFTQMTPFSVDLSAESPFSVDTGTLWDAGVFIAMQSLFVDNSANANKLTLTLPHLDSAQVSIPPYAQGWIPFPVAERAQFTVNGNGYTGTIKMVASSLFIPPYIWLPDSSGTLVSVTNDVNVVFAGGTNNDESSAQPAPAANLLLTIPVNTARKYVEVQNQSDTDIQVVLDAGSGTTTTIILAAGGAGLQGGGWNCSNFTGRVRVFCATAGKQVAAYEI